MGRIAGYRHSRALEGPVEATYELEEKFRNFLPDLRIAHIIIVIFLGLFWLILLAELVFVAFEVYNLFLEGRIIIDLEMIIFILFKLGYVFIFALTVTQLLLITQTWSFIRTLISRYDSLDFMTDSESMVLSKRSLKPKEDPFELIKAPLKGINDHIPLLLKMFRTCQVLYIIMAAVTSLSLLATLAFGFLAGFETPFNLSVFGVMTVVLKLNFVGGAVMASVLAGRVFRFFNYFKLRSQIIDQVRDEGGQKVPKGKTPEDRFIKYLFRKEAVLAGQRELATEVIPGRDKSIGRILESPLKEHPESIPDENTTCSIFIKTVNRPLKINHLKDYVEETENFVRTKNSYPLRIAIILTGKAENLSDEVYEHVTTTPAFVLNDEEHFVQLVSEDEGYYSFIPFIAQPV